MIFFFILLPVYCRPTKLHWKDKRERYTARGRVTARERDREIE